MAYALVVLAFTAAGLDTNVSSVVGFYSTRQRCEAQADYFAQYRMPRELYHCLRVYQD